MRTIEVFRNNCHSGTGMKKVLEAIWKMPDFTIIYPMRQYYAPEQAYQWFMATNNTYGNTGILYHVFALDFARLDGEQFAFETMMGLAESYFRGFQCIAAQTRDEDGSLRIILIVNAVSYMDGRRLYDNNRAVINLKKSLEQITRTNWDLMEGTLFNGNGDLIDSYQSLL